MYRDHLYGGRSQRTPHLSSDYHPVDFDFPCDHTRACQLYAEHRAAARRTA